ncbi:hypothetical protein F5B20DRAFT_177468 [Whalleya microplaca]|nr:hypothetical protein F5B20DRAFT_177468 [Whalleya microplaca]
MATILLIALDHPISPLRPARSPYKIHPNFPYHTSILRSTYTYVYTYLFLLFTWDGNGNSQDLDGMDHCILRAPIPSPVILSPLTSYLHVASNALILLIPIGFLIGGSNKPCLVGDSHQSTSFSYHPFHLSGWLSSDSRLALPSSTTHRPIESFKCRRQEPSLRFSFLLGRRWVLDFLQERQCLSLSLCLFEYAALIFNESSQLSVNFVVGCARLGILPG